MNLISEIQEGEKVMNGKDSWKKTDEVQVDLPDLLRSFAARWKQAAACMLVFAILLGGYGWVRQKNARQEPASIKDTKMTKEETKTVEDTVQLAEETEELEDYMRHSVLMKVNPYRRNRTTLLFSVDGATNRTLPAIVESYLGFLTSKGITDALQKVDGRTWRMDNRYVAELIAAWQRSDSSFPYQILTEDIASAVPEQALFYVEATGTDAEMAAKLAGDIQSALEDYSGVVKKSCGTHKLTLRSSQDSVKIDSGLLAQRDEKKQQLKAKQDSLKAASDALSMEQKAVFENEFDSGEKEEAEEERVSQGNRIPVKYIVFGLAGGIGVYGAWFALWYLLRDTVKSAAQLQAQYRFPLYGSISVNAKDSSAKGGCRRYEQEKEILLSRTRLSCQKQGIQKLCLAADFEPDEKEQACLQELCGGLEQCGISAAAAGKIGENVAQWDAVSAAGNVLLVCKRGVTTHRGIDGQMEFYQDNGIRVLGAAVLDTDAG